MVFSNISQITRVFIITGNVQGVGFRFFARDQANRLGITGVVLNQINGSVLVVARAPKESLTKFKQILSVGPQLSEIKDVEEVEVSDNDLKPYQVFLSSNTFHIVKSIHSQKI